MKFSQSFFYKFLICISVVIVNLSVSILNNKEAETMHKGKLDYENFIQPTKSLVCVTFIKADYQTLKILHKNMNLMRGYCDWIVIFYDGSDELIKDFCNLISIDSIDHINSNSIVSSIDKTIRNSTSYSFSIPLKITLCKKADKSTKQPLIKVPLSSGGIIKQRKSIPKSVLYQEIVDTIPSYEMTFIMDEDIILDGFSITRFIKKWKCSFGINRPLIVQPLIAESTQYFPYVHEKVWKNNNFYSKVTAATVGLVEQQVPFFNTVFLVWYIRHVLSQIKDVALKYGVDQSIDKTWCKAADMYAREVLNHKLINNNSMCAVIIATPPVHHRNLHSLSNKRANRKHYVNLGLKVNDLYKRLFPSWVLDDITTSVNPLDPIYGKKYHIFKWSTSGKECMRSLDSYMFKNHTLHVERYNI